MKNTESYPGAADRDQELLQGNFHPVYEGDREEGTDAQKGRHRAERPDHRPEADVDEVG